LGFVRSECASGAALAAQAVDRGSSKVNSGRFIAKMLVETVSVLAVDRGSSKVNSERFIAKMLVETVSVIKKLNSHDENLGEDTDATTETLFYQIMTFLFSHCFCFVKILDDLCQHFGSL
jgi:FAD synthase